MASFDERILNGMGVLTAIVDSGSFAAAGEILGLSQPGVSRAIARLEARLGVRLLDRTTRAVGLTDEGRRFHAQVAPLLAALEEAATSATEGRGAIRGRLRVNVDPYFARLVLAPRLGEFLAAHPQLALDLETRDQLGDLVGEGFDLALRFGHPRPSTLVARKLLDTRILTVASPAYLKRCGKPAEPRELLAGGHTCIQFRDPQTRRPFAWEFHRKRRRLVIEPPGALTVNDAGVLMGACLAGHGLAQVFELAWRRCWPRGSWSTCSPTGRTSASRCTRCTPRASTCRPRRGPSSTSWWRCCRHDMTA